MTADREITLYHADVDPLTRMEKFRRNVFPARVYQTVYSDSLRRQNGPWRERETVIRIPTDGEVTAAVGDRVALGACGDPEPPTDSLLVCRVADNRRGSRRVRHWKIVCR